MDQATKLERPFFGVASNRREAVLRLPGKPPVGMSLEEVEAVLSKLGIMRGNMVPEVAATWRPGQLTKNVYRNPAWSIETDVLTGDAVLHLRDLRFGWLHYIFTRNEARKLGQALLAIADAPAPAMSGRA
jgi:hypothetical protein